MLPRDRLYVILLHLNKQKKGGNLHFLGVLLLWCCRAERLMLQRRQRGRKFVTTVCDSIMFYTHFACWGMNTWVLPCSFSLMWCPLLSAQDRWGDRKKPNKHNVASFHQQSGAVSSRRRARKQPLGEIESPGPRLLWSNHKLGIEQANNKDVNLSGSL